MACRFRRQERLVPSFPLATVPLLSKKCEGRALSGEGSAMEGLIAPLQETPGVPVPRSQSSQGVFIPPQRQAPLLHAHAPTVLQGDLHEGEFDEGEEPAEAFSELECEVDPTVAGPTEILSGLYLGCHGDALQGPSLQARNITRILNVAAECENDEELKRYGVKEVRKIALQDHSDELISAVWDESCAWIHDVLLDEKKGGGVLVHCKMGVSRSASIVVAYLMKYGSPSSPGHWSYRRSFEWVKSRRPQISPNLGFTLSLRRLEGELSAGTPPIPIATPPPSWSCSSASMGVPRREVRKPEESPHQPAVEGAEGGNNDGDATTRSQEVPVPVPLSSTSSKSSWFPNSTPPMRQTLFPSLDGIGGSPFPPAATSMGLGAGRITILDYSRLGLDPPSDSRTVSDGGLTDASPSPAMSKEPSFC